MALVFYRCHIIVVYIGYGDREYGVNHMKFDNVYDFFEKIKPEIRDGVGISKGKLYNGKIRNLNFQFMVY